jgi:hypothetical protein
MKIKKVEIKDYKAFSSMAKTVVVKISFITL